MDNFPPQLEPLAFPIEKLKHDEANPRQHDDKNLGAIRASLKRWGWRNVVVARKADRVIIAGNGRIEAARSLGWTHAPVVFVADDVTEATAFAIADNRAGELAAWNLGNLTAQLDGLDEAALGDLGFTADDFDDLLDQHQNPFRTVRVPIGDLKPHPRNYQKHPADQLKHIQASIAAHGYYRNIVVARDNTILAGHGVVEASRAMGKKRVPVVRLDVAPDDPRALKVLTSDNEISNLAEVDDRGCTPGAWACWIRRLRARLAQGLMHGLAGHSEHPRNLCLAVLRDEGGHVDSGERAPRPDRAQRQLPDVVVDRVPRDPDFGHDLADGPAAAVVEGDEIPGLGHAWPAAG
jgi:ParB-like chromosome segregation protein Spo0J